MRMRVVDIVPVNRNIYDHAGSNEFATYIAVDQLDVVVQTQLDGQSDFELPGKLRVPAPLDALNYIPECVPVIYPFRGVRRSHYFSMCDPALAAEVVNDTARLIGQTARGPIGGRSDRITSVPAANYLRSEVVYRHGRGNSRKENLPLGDTMRHLALSTHS